MNFEANRKKILEDLQRSKRKKLHSSRAASGVDYSIQAGNGREKVPVALFGKKSPFFINLEHALANRCVPTLKDDVDKMVDFIEEKSINHLIIDIDPPSDYHLGVNLLTIVKSLSSTINVFVCTRDINSQQSQVMQNHGCALLEKPVSIPQLIGYIV